MKQSALQRKTPLKRTPFKSSAKHGAVRATSKPRVKTLRSKQLPVTAEEKALWDRLATEVGCVACMIDGNFNPHVSIHHIDGRTKPGCHKLILPLCGEHHQHRDDDPAGRVGVHPHKARFEKLYGSQLELLALCMTILERNKK